MAKFSLSDRLYWLKRYATPEVIMNTMMEITNSKRIIKCSTYNSNGEIVRYNPRWDEKGIMSLTDDEFSTYTDIFKPEVARRRLIEKYGNKFMSSDFMRLCNGTIEYQDYQI